MEIREQTHTIFKRDSKGGTRVWYAMVGTDGTNWAWRTVSGLEEGKKVESGWKLVEQKNVGKANETSLHEQALAEMDAELNKKLARGYFTSLDDIDNFEKIKPMLAAKYEDVSLDFESKRYYTQPKLDGIRCIARKDGLWSRAGKEIVAVPHIQEALVEYFEKHPNAILDGELYNHDLKDDFNKITSLVRKTKPKPEDIEESSKLVQYHVYDLISSNEDFAKRIGEVVLIEFDPCIQIVETLQVNNKDQLDSNYSDYIQAGYEGQMVRVDAAYQQNKRSKFLLKRKEFITDEYKVIGVSEGKGNWHGMIKRFHLVDSNDVTFDAGVRGTQDQMRELFESEKTPDWATLRYFELTPDGIPRFPVVVDYGYGVRED